jgi:hypothetical protein
MLILDCTLDLTFTAYNICDYNLLYGTLVNSYDYCLQPIAITHTVYSLSVVHYTHTESSWSAVPLVLRLQLSMPDSLPSWVPKLSLSHSHKNSTHGAVINFILRSPLHTFNYPGAMPIANNSLTLWPSA